MRVKSADLASGFEQNFKTDWQIWVDMKNLKTAISIEKNRLRARKASNP